MGSFLKSLLLVAVLLFYFCECQQTEDIIQIKLDAIFEAQSTIIRRLDEQDRKMEAMETKIESKMEEMETKIERKMEDLRVEYQQCAQRSQVDSFQNIFTTGQLDILTSLKQCPCNEAITDFRELLATDECQEDSHNCSNMATCTDTPGLYKCTCLPGYSGDGFTCQDIDECTSRTYQCHSNATCVNTDGSYRCQCHSNATCVNTDGSYRCQCHSNACVNTDGSYKCTCLPGYSSDGFTCQDIDECTSGTYQCHPKATCVNTDGSYRCQCHSLYAGDGHHTCDPVCEHPSLYLSSLGCITLMSGKGEFRVDDPLDGSKKDQINWEYAKEKCRATGRELLGGFTRQELGVISQHFFPFMGGLCCAKIGVRHTRWIYNDVLVIRGLWASGEPDEGDEECGYVDVEPPTINLADGKCNNLSYALCQHRY